MHITFREQALRLAGQGYNVFPLIPGGKLPLIDGWQDRATRDPHRINRWWTDPIMGTEQPYNIGICTTRFGTDDALLVVDVDNKGEKRGSDTLLMRELAGCEFPPTAVQCTPSGGRHLIYRTNGKPARTSAGLLGPGLDTRGHGGFIVAAGSVLDSGEYVMRSTPLATAPEWLLVECARAPAEQKSNLSTASPVDRDRAFKRGMQHLATAPASAQGRRNADGYKIAAALREIGVVEADCLLLMATDWRCDPPLDDGELQHVIRSAYRYATAAPGSAAPEAQFKPVPVEPVSKAAQHPFDELNEQFAFVVAGGGHHILWETTDHKGRWKLEHLAESTFHRMLASKMLTVGKKTEPLTQLWMQSERRRSYQGLCFHPGSDAPDGWYNMWRGFATEPGDPSTASAEARAALEAWQEHAFKNVCRGNKKLYQWLLGYFAHLVQRPAEKPLVALVLRGGKGVGKNALIELGIHGILGAHSMVVADRRYLIGNFNGHFENLLLIAFDEAFWSGDKQAEGILKSLITGNTHVIEHKGKEPYTVENKCRVIIIGNEDWLVPASHDERRFAVFDVGDGRRGDREFFERMRLGMEAGGYALLLRFLLDFDLTAVDINAAPATAALVDQKYATLEPVHQWWLNCLTEGWVVGGDFGGKWPRETDKERLRNALARYIKDHNIRGYNQRIPDDRALGRLLKKVCPSITPGKRREGDATVNTYRIPRIEVARAEWGAYIGHETEWNQTE